MARIRTGISVRIVDLDENGFPILDENDVIYVGKRFEKEERDSETYQVLYEYSYVRSEGEWLLAEKKELESVLLTGKTFTKHQEERNFPEYLGELEENDKLLKAWGDIARHEERLEEIKAKLKRKFEIEDKIDYETRFVTQEEFDKWKELNREIREFAKLGDEKT